MISQKFRLALGAGVACLLFGASLSVVKSAVCPPMRFRASPMVFGSTALTMMPATPAATRSSIRRVWIAAEDCSGYLKTRL